MLIRPAAETDVAALAAIYAHHVIHGVGTFEEEPPDQAEMARRLADVQARSLPWLIAEDGEGRLLGFAYAGPFRLRSAYKFTVEDAVYVSKDAHRQGVGRALLGAVIAACEAQGLRQMLALIGDSRNAASIGLHTAVGFEPAGLMRDVGFKTGRWLDVVVMQKRLGHLP